MKEIVIKIPDKAYDVLTSSGVDWLGAEHILNAVANGKVLPKGHDKLIAEPTEEEIAKTIGGNNEFADCIREAVKAVFNNANAAVEADKGEEARSLLN